MHFPALLSALLAAAAANLARASAGSHSQSHEAPIRIASIFIQPIPAPSSSQPPSRKLLPTLLAEIALPDAAELPPASADSSTTTPAQVLSYEAPDLPEGTQLVRIGVHDPSSLSSSSSSSGRWTVAAAHNFAKGYAPHFVLTLDEGEGDEGEALLGVVCRGVRIDAGHTRDFGPQAAVVRSARGAQPALGRPVVLSPEGRKVAPEQERSFLQKYWWVLAIGGFLLLSGGGDQQ